MLTKNLSIRLSSISGIYQLQFYSPVYREKERKKVPVNEENIKRRSNPWRTCHALSATFSTESWIEDTVARESRCKTWISSSSGDIRSWDAVERDTESPTRATLQKPPETRNI
jgi:hypothetical protein